MIPTSLVSLLPAVANGIVTYVKDDQALVGLIQFIGTLQIL